MPLLPRPRRLRGKFLWLTVPVVLACAAVFLVFLLDQRIRELGRLNLAVARQHVERDAGLLSGPMWNVDTEGVHAVIDSAIATSPSVCIRLHGLPGASRPLEAGRCETRGRLQSIDVPIVRQTSSGVLVIGRLEHWVDARVTRAMLQRELWPLLALMTLLVTALLACTFVALQRTILTPLRRVADSIRAYRERGERVPVVWPTQDELGEFIAEYNAGLDRQAAAERGLAERLSFQRALQNTLPMPLAFAHRDLQLFDANPEFIRELRLDPQAGLPNLADCLPGADWAAVARLPAGQIYREELHYEDGPLAGRTFVLVLSAFANGGLTVAGVVLVLQDITQRITSERALQASVEESRRMLQELRTAQNNLVQAEQLASLGSLVAGVAHEVNTPVGSSLTVASALGDWVRDFRRAMATGGLKRSQLDDFVAQVDEASVLLQRSLHSAAEQIQKFKQVAADQASARRRPFDLAHMLDEVLSTLKPRLKHSPHRVEVAVPEGIILDSYPGPLGQVVSNCFTNALLHGFDGVARGTIRISAHRVEADAVRLVIADNGRGIEPEHLPRVFDPFFTTKLGRGGTGLGLNLVYTMVTGLLGGRVSVESSPGHGTQIVLDLPLSAPEENADREGARRSHA